jgi:arginine/serine-rich splicing factor 4/5/6
MTGFGFVEFENTKDAEDAVQQFNGKPFMGTNIVVEFAKESRPRREPYEERSHGSTSSRARRPPGIRILVSGLSRDTSWQVWSFSVSCALVPSLVVVVPGCHSFGLFESFVILGLDS